MRLQFKVVCVSKMLKSIQRRSIMKHGVM